jgi:tRNA threonylcarbamoyladenosine biosynthesis protein TsaB
MRILALETSTSAGSVALLEDDAVQAELGLAAGLRSAQSLVPAIGDLLLQLRWNAKEISLVTVAEGPGSFTGLRIGATAAKVFAYATGASLVGVNTLETIAGEAPEGAGRLNVVIDAQRGEVFTADFARGLDGVFTPCGPTRLIDRAGWLAERTPGEQVTGPGLWNWVDRLPAGVCAVEPHHWEPRAAAVGRLGLAAYRAGRRDNAMSFVPRYYRKSAAEERLEANDADEGTAAP